MAGGGTTLLKLALRIDEISAKLDNDEQRVGAEIVRKALSYPLKLIANNAGVNGSVVVQKVTPPSLPWGVADESEGQKIVEGEQTCGHVGGIANKPRLWAGDGIQVPRRGARKAEGEGLSRLWC